MNETKVRQLIDEWDKLLENGEKTAKVKASKNRDGLEGRITRTTGMPVIFDSDTFDRQNNLMAKLCLELPQFRNLIASQPEIMDGHAWIRDDFIGLYFEHFRIVISKLRQFTNQTTNV